MVVFLCYTSSSVAQNFDFNTKCKSAYQEIISMKSKSAKSILDAERTEHSKNLIPIYLENYIDFLELFCTENKSRYQFLLQNENTRITALQKGDKNSPYFLFTQAEIYIQWAVIKLKFGDYVSAILDIRKANNLLESNALKFKDFKPNKKSQAMLQCLFGSIPDSYKWGGSLLGLSGSIEEGIKTLSTLIENNSTDFIYKDETLVIYSMIQFHLNNRPEEAWNILKKNNYPISGNALSYYITGYIGTYGGHSAEALRILTDMPRTNTVYQSMPIVDFLIGLCKMYALDKTANVHFDIFLKNTKSENYKKTVQQKLAWLALLNSGAEAYKTAIAKVKDIGVEIIDADKQAMKEANSNQVPDIKLLKLRLLCDGGNYDKAKLILQTIQDDDYVDTKKKLEYLYRKARYLHLTKDISNALVAYQVVINQGKDKPYYYAANAALQMAYIYEEKNNKTEAIKYYNLCLSMKDHEYVNSLSQKAKAGLNRLD